MSKLYAVDRGHFCGPSALAAISGESAEAMEVEINLLRGHHLTKHVKGTYWHELRRVLVAKGYVVTIVRLPPKRPLTLMDVNRRLGWSNVHLVETARHFMVVRDGLVVDTETPSGKPLADHPNRLRHIERIAIVHAPKRSETRWVGEQIAESLKPR